MSRTRKPRKRYEEFEDPATRSKWGWESVPAAEAVLNLMVEAGALPSVRTYWGRRHAAASQVWAATYQRRARQVLAKEFGDVEVVITVATSGSVKYWVLRHVVASGA